jgi:hypothetical protein
VVIATLIDRILNDGLQYKTRRHLRFSPFCFFAHSSTRHTDSGPIPVLIFPQLSAHVLFIGAFLNYSMSLDSEVISSLEKVRKNRMHQNSDPSVSPDATKIASTSDRDDPWFRKNFIIFPYTRTSDGTSDSRSFAHSIHNQPRLPAVADLIDFPHFLFKLLQEFRI